MHHCLLPEGTVKSEIASTLASTGFTWPCPTIWANNVKFAWQNSLFVKLTVSVASLRLLTKFLIVCKCRSHSSLKMIASSIYALQPARLNIKLLTKRWNVAREFFIPNGITLYWNNLSGVTNAEISYALFVRGICQNPLSRSNLVPYLACPILSIQTSVSGMGNVSVLVTEFTLW